MNRRDFLKTSALATAWAALPLHQAVAAGTILSTSVAITGISAQTDLERLLTVAGTLLDRGIWLTCGIRMPETTADATGLPDVIQALINLGSGIDIALDVPGLSALSPYFQSRAVFEAEQTLAVLLAHFATPLPIQTVISDMAANIGTPVGVRASGLRTVLIEPEADTPMNSETWNGQVVRFFGGRRVVPGRLPDIGRPGTPGAENTMIYYLSAAEMSGVDKTELADWSTQFGDALSRAELSGSLALMTVSDFQLRDWFEQRQLVTVLLQQPAQANAEDLVALSAFSAELARAEIPSTICPEGSSLWVGQPGLSSQIVPISIHCEGLDEVRIDPLSVRLEPGHAIRLVDGRSQVAGIDGCAVLDLPMFSAQVDEKASDIVATFALAGDLVLRLTPAQISKAEARTRLLADLKGLRETGVTQFLGLADLVQFLSSQEAIPVRHNRTRQAVANAPRTAPVPRADAERTQLLEDARHAWGFIDKYTESATGICPAALDSRPGGDVLRAVTMWDVGSNLNAIVAAAELGLIQKKEAETRIRKILPHLAGRETDGRRLPQGWIRTDRARWGNRDFDGCDGGRLLASLDNVRQRLGLAAELEKLVASWDLNKVIIDRVIYSVIDRQLQSTYSSHCAHYSALAFRRWGFDVASPYETFDNRPPGDGEMALLEAISKIGPLGTEPLLLEAMELGMSKESTYVAEVLLKALEEEEAETGRLLCVSETPIDTPPWFIYQGLELGSGPRGWRLDTVDKGVAYRTKEAAEALLTFSTKAAFLWQAYWPCPFTDQLIGFARDHARNTNGFASGVNVKTKRPTVEYSDLNTNSIILQAIAHSLRDPA